MRISTGVSEGCPLALPSLPTAPIAAAKPRLDSNGTSASIVQSESPWPFSELAAVRIASSVAWACPWPSCGRADARAAARNRPADCGSVSSGNGSCGSAPTGTAHTTRSRFSVSVPVLSKQMVSTRPRASMVRGARTSAPRAVSRWAAESWERVATRGRPSGTAATAIATPSATAWRSGARRSSANADTVAPPASVSGSTLLVSSRSRAWIPAAVSTSATAEIARCAAVPTPVATTIARAWPATMVLPSKSMLARSGSLTATGSTCLSTGSDSPVRKDSSTSRSSATSRRASAGTTSGAARSMTSPGRRVFADTVAVRVACWAASSRRRVVATAGTTTRRTIWSCSANSSAAADSARSRCAPPVIALTVMTPATRRASMLLPTMADAAAPTARMGVSGSASSVRVADASRAALCSGLRRGAKAGL